IGLLVAALKHSAGGGVKVRVGINSGPVVVTIASDSGHVSYDALGQTVHLASRMEAAAEPGAIAVSQHTAQRIQHLFECQSLGTKTLKGFSEPKPIYRLIGLVSQQRPKHAPELGNIESTLIGRARELGAIK